MSKIEVGNVIKARLMEKVDRLDFIIGNLLSAVQQVRRVTSFTTHTEDLLQAFWCLQDQTHRLLAEVLDGDLDYFVLNTTAPDLVPTIVDALRRARNSAVFQIAAVSQACGATNESLLALQGSKRENGGAC